MGLLCKLRKGIWSSEQVDDEEENELLKSFLQCILEASLHHCRCFRMLRFQRQSFLS